MFQSLGAGREASLGHIAIVDDSEPVLQALSRLLTMHAFQVRCYRSAFEFLKSLEDRTPDCLITDFRMNDMTGLELLHHLAGTGLRIRTIVMTADDQPGLRHRCELAGAFRFFVKPVKANCLLKAIKAATVEKSRIQ